MGGKQNVRRGNSRRRNAVLRYVRESDEPCWICGLPIDRDVAQGDPLCCECDELVPVSRGGSPYARDNVAAAHRCCNVWRGAKSVQTVAVIRAEVMRRFGGWSSPLDFVAKARQVVVDERAQRRAVREARRSRGVRVERTSGDW